MAPDKLTMDILRSREAKGGGKATDSDLGKGRAVDYGLKQAFKENIKDEMAYVGTMTNKDGEQEDVYADSKGVVFGKGKLHLNKNAVHMGI